jgi:hypothetical protein
VYVSRLPVFKRAICKNYNFSLLINGSFNLFIPVSVVIISHSLKIIILSCFEILRLLILWLLLIYIDKWRIITQSNKNYAQHQDVNSPDGNTCVVVAAA